MSNINQIAEDNALRAIYISSYIPRKCGVATFTKDLTTAINNQNPSALAEIVALDDNKDSYNYPWEVKLRIFRDNPEDYMIASNYINQSSADIVNIEHEFGLFGGVDGDYVLPLIDSLTKPIVTVFHTILPVPDEHKKYIMKRIIDKSSAIIVLTKKSKEILINVYECNDPDKIAVIYHGVPDFTFNQTDKYKKLLKIDADKLILMSGLIGPGKGIEYAIESMKKITNVYPKVKFYIIGETHPSLVEKEKESYRESLLKLIKKLKVTSKIKLINKFLDLDELIKYYKAADFYLTPHLDPQQASSGTMAKAMGAGKVCISTPYFYAEEMLSHDRGILVPFRDSEAIADAVIKVIGSPELMKSYEENAYKIGKLMQWPNVANKYLKVFNIVKEKNGVKK